MDLAIACGTAILSIILLLCALGHFCMYLKSWCRSNCKVELQHTYHQTTCTPQTSDHRKRLIDPTHEPLPNSEDEKYHVYEGDDDFPNTQNPNEAYVDMSGTAGRPRIYELDNEVKGDVDDKGYIMPSRTAEMSRNPPSPEQTFEDQTIDQWRGETGGSFGVGGSGDAQRDALKRDELLKHYVN